MDSTWGLDWFESIVYCFRFCRENETASIGALCVCVWVCLTPLILIAKIEMHIAPALVLVAQRELGASHGDQKRMRFVVEFA